MRVSIAKERCIGAGACHSSSPMVFDLDADGLVVLLEDSPVPGLHQSVEDAAESCPGGVIEISE